MDLPIHNYFFIYKTECYSRWVDFRPVDSQPTTINSSIINSNTNNTDTRDKQNAGLIY